IGRASGMALPWFGLVCAFTSMISYAFYVVVSHRLSKKHSSWTLILYSYGIVSIFWFVLQNAGETFRAVSVHHLWNNAISFAGLSTLIPFTIFLLGLRRVSATGASIAST